MEAFYSSVTSFCFVLMGLWWNVAQARNDEWGQDPKARSLAGGVYMSFLLPGLMSLAAQLAGEARILWRLVFILAAMLGAITAYGFLRATRSQVVGSGGWVRRHYWVVVLLYALVAVFGAVPELAGGLGLKPLQVEGLLLSALIFVGVSFAWEILTEPRPASDEEVLLEHPERNLDTSTPLTRTLMRLRSPTPPSTRR